MAKRQIRQHVLGTLSHRHIGRSGSHRPHKNSFILGAIHANAIAQQCASRADLGWVNAEHGHFFIAKAMQDAQQQFIDEGTFARAAQAGDDDETASGQIEIEILQVIVPDTA